jgi:hypothetical protein
MGISIMPNNLKAMYRWLLKKAKVVYRNDTPFYVDIELRLSTFYKGVRLHK